MKHLCISILGVLSIIILYGFSPVSKIEQPYAPKSDSYKIYKNYLCSSRSDSTFLFSRYISLVLNSDNTVETIDYETLIMRKLGEWRLKGDTLLIYQLYSSWADPRYKAPYDSLSLDECRALYPTAKLDSSMDFRNFLSGLSQRPITDLSFGLNVAAFKVYSGGDSITGINDRNHIKGFNVSNEQVGKEQYPSYDFIPWDYPTTMPKREPVKINKRPSYFFLDTLEWEPRAWTRCNDIVGKVESVESVDGKMHRLRLDVSGNAFTLINPTLLESFSTQPGPVRLKSERISAWLSKAKVGDVLSIDKLYRVDNTDSTFYWTHGDSCVDTIYVMDSDVKGYWIATPKKLIE